MKLRRRSAIPWWGRLELRVIAALVLLGTLCVGSSAYLVQLSVAYFDGRWGGALDQALVGTDDVGEFHQRLVDAKIAEYEARTRALGFELALGDTQPAPADDRTRIAELLNRDPDLVGLAVTRPSGSSAEVDRASEYPEDRFEWYDATTELGLPGSRSGGQLRVVFRIDPEIDARFQEVGARRREIGRQRRDTAEIEQAVIRVIGIGSTAVLGIALVIGLLVARTITRKVGEVSRVMARVGHGDLRARARVRGRDEIAVLAQAFNRMLDELAAAQDKLAYLQRIGAWQEMARRIAHEIKNPLTPIQLAVQQLREKDPGLSPEFTKLLRNAVEIVEDEVDGLRRMVTGFSQFAKVPEVRTDRIELRRVLEEFERAYGHLTERADDVLRVSDELPELVVDADRQLLKQVLVNLVENAVLSAREAGRAPVQVEVTCVRVGNAVEIRVDDNGPGVPDDMRERVFEPYQTTRAQGTGLGLAIVKKVVLDHRGEVWVEPSPLGGARFVVRLPIPQPGSAASAASMTIS
ncbi:MAG: HAMP domain-containing histidine kinase [Deltaproteobacteria bacterium]|nr:HAMP domain-containing histidine kinase [Nannocystaceae bacterium]